MTEEEIIAGVRECIGETLSIPLEEVGLDDKLIDDLGADSLDLLDLSFQMQQRFHVTISPRDLERRTQEKLGEAPVAVDGVYSPEAMNEFRANMPEIPIEELRDGLAVADLPRCFRTSTMVRLVTRLLEEQHA